jgi:hypothetical protein
MAISITKISGNGQSAKLNALYNNNLQVQVSDNATIPPTLITSGTVSFQNINNLVTQPAAPFNGAGSQTGELGPGGYASTSIKPRANGVAGKVTIRCWGFGAETNFTLTNKAPSGTAAASEIALTAGDNQVVLQGGGAPIAPIVKVTDQYDAAFPGASVTWVLPSSGASGTFTVGGGTSTTSTTDASGFATCPAFTANSQLGPWAMEARVTSDTSLSVDVHFNTNPSSGTEVCVNLIVPTTSVSAVNPGSQFAWINPANWPTAGVAQVTINNSFATALSDLLAASGFGATIAAIPNGAEITRLTYQQDTQRTGDISTQLKIAFENTSFASPRVTTNNVVTPPGAFANNTFTWTTFSTPNPGSKLLGSDVKSANFRIVQYVDTSVVSGTSAFIQVKNLKVSICYIEPAAGGGAGAAQFCEV